MWQINIQPTTLRMSFLQTPRLWALPCRLLSNWKSHLLQQSVISLLLPEIPPLQNDTRSERKSVSVRRRVWSSICGSLLSFGLTPRQDNEDFIKRICTEVELTLWLIAMYRKYCSRRASCSQRCHCLWKVVLALCLSVVAFIFAAPLWMSLWPLLAVLVL